MKSLQRFTAIWLRIIHPYNRTMTNIDDLSSQVLSICKSRGLTLATAESLTAGMVCSTLCNIDGASEVVRGGIISYATQIKEKLLNVDGSRLREFGAVDPVVCEQMAIGAQDAFDCQVAFSTTGVAGPTPQDGHPVGEVHIGVLSPEGFVHRQLDLQGSRQDIRHQTVVAVLELALKFLNQRP